VGPSLYRRGSCLIIIIIIIIIVVVVVVTITAVAVVVVVVIVVVVIVPKAKVELLEFLFGRSWVRLSVRKPAMLNDVPHGFSQSHQIYYIQKNAISGTRITHGEVRNACRMLVGKRDHLRHTGVNGRIILKWFCVGYEDVD
jgi:hypothetical protein